LTFSDADGHRYQLFVTDHPEEDVAFLEALYRGGAAVNATSAI